MSGVDSLADKAEATSEQLAGSDGVKGKLADELAEKPGEPRHAPSGPQLGTRPKKKSGGPIPFLVVGIALAGGIALAKLVDWRGHAHPR